MGRRVWLCLPPLMLYGLDVTLTLFGQSSAYWSGDRDAVLEINPVARWLLIGGPWWFIAVASAWAVCFATIVFVWQQRLAVVMAFVLTLPMLRVRRVGCFAMVAWDGSPPWPCCWRRNVWYRGAGRTQGCDFIRVRRESEKRGRYLSNETLGASPKAT